MRKSVIYTLLAISLFAMLGTGCSKKAEQKISEKSMGGVCLQIKYFEKNVQLSVNRRVA